MRYDDFTKAVARFICNPCDGIEIGGVTYQLLDIIKTQTKKNRNMRREIHEWIEVYTELGYARDKFIENPNLAKEDYDNLFYK